MGILGFSARILLADHFISMYQMNWEMIIFHFVFKSLTLYPAKKLITGGRYWRQEHAD